MNPNEASAVFTRLRSDHRQSTANIILSKPSEVSADRGLVRFALSQTGQPLLLLPVDIRQELAGIQTGDALRVRLDDISFDGVLSRFLEFSCLDPALESVFSDVCNYLINRIAEGESVYGALTQTLNQFSQLFHVHNTSAPSLEIIQGLIGELLLLEELITANTKAVSAWTGPLGRAHDFRHGSHAIEVKTLSRTSPGHIEISSLDQLMVPNRGSLHLRVTVLIQDANGEHTTSSIGKRLEAILGGSTLLQDTLELLGCKSLHDPAWSRYSFALESHTHYIVNPSFPALTTDRLQAAELYSGIVAVRYTIDPASSCTTISKADALSQLKKSLNTRPDK